MMIEIECVVDSKSLLGEGTYWDAKANVLWWIDIWGPTIHRTDPTTGKEVFVIRVGNGPTGIAFGDGAAWVANSLDGNVSRIDPETNSQAAVIPVGGLVLWYARRSDLS